MTATRIVRPATLAVAAVALWVLAVSLLWRTKVPAHLPLPPLDERRVFGAQIVSAGIRFDRFFEIEWLLAMLATLAVLVVMVRRAPRVVRFPRLRSVNAGSITGGLLAAGLWGGSR